MSPQPLVAIGHGKNEPRGIKRVTRSSLHEGRFGRLFRGLDPAPELSNAELTALAKKMQEPKAGGAKLDNPKIPSAYTYFGQFVDHDITFDPVSSLQRRNDPDALTDFRTPRFDLDCVYGSGPADDPFLYVQPDRLRLLIDSSNKNGEPDLQRNAQGVALIGDPRNDENIIVSQLQLAFLRFHNKVAERVAKDKSVPAARKFQETQKLVRWHYQWVILEDFLPRIVGKGPLKDRVKRKGKGVEISLRWFKPKNNPFMPVEFSVAAYRYGHSQVRGRYDLNQIVQNVPIFLPKEKVGELDDLRGFRPLPGAWTIDWSFFIGVPGQAKKPQLSRRIDAKLTKGLFDLPGFPQAESSLAFRNLKRGQALGLPSGQDVADAMELKPLGAGKLGAPVPTPLWFYILKESGLKESGGGQHLGPVGGGIVAEVLLGLLKGDRHSFVNAQPGWRPTLGPKAGKFTLADLIRFATN
ncbi:MAG TPA: heme peroxidase family protein [Solirubrobacterales bacterium]|nr:heme peroxidase family protein [Solirubrobacterales bacterium]